MLHKQEDIRLFIVIIKLQADVCRRSAYQRNIRNNAPDHLDWVEMQKIVWWAREGPCHGVSSQGRALPIQRRHPVLDQSRADHVLLRRWQLIGQDLLTDTIDRKIGTRRRDAHVEQGLRFSEGE